jgi:antitoxin VapB
MRLDANASGDICLAAMITARYVRLFKVGRDLAVRIPREFELPGDTAMMRKGSRLILEPVR